MSESYTDPNNMKQAIYNFADNLRDAMAIGKQASLVRTYTNINLSLIHI